VWTEARHTARSVSGTRDPLRRVLADWWAAEGLPAVDQLTEAQALTVLDKIALLEWSTRPFTPDTPDPH
jgi:hypothetical protein